MSKIVVIDYTNYKQERRNRRIRPTGLAYTSNEWHKSPCWMVLARDVDIDDARTFPLQNIHSWTEIE